VIGARNEGERKTLVVAELDIRHIGATSRFSLDCKELAILEKVFRPDCMEG